MTTMKRLMGVCATLLATLLYLALAFPGFALAGTVTVGYTDGTTITKANMIDLGTVDLSTIDSSQSELVVSKRVSVKLEGFSGNTYFGDWDAGSVDGDPVPGAFSCSGIGNTGDEGLVTGSFTVFFDAAQYSAGTYTAHVGVSLPGTAASATSANSGALSVTDGILSIPVKITLTGTNPTLGPKVARPTVKAGNARVEVLWTPVEGIYDYTVFRREGRDANASNPELAEYQRLSTVSLMAGTASTSFSDPRFVDCWVNNGQEYSYIVLAGGLSNPFLGNASASARVTPNHTVRVKPAPPYGLEDRGGTADSIYLEWGWNRVGGQPNPDNEYDTGDSSDGSILVDHFNVYRNGVLVQQVKQNSFTPRSGYNDAIWYQWSATVPVEQTGADYSFWVTAVSTDGTEGYPSDKITARAEDDEPAAILGHTADYLEVEVWDDDDGHVVATYKGMNIDIHTQSTDHVDMWRKPADAADSDYTAVAFTQVDGTQLDTAVVQGGVYTYKAIAVDWHGRKSDPYIFNVAAVEADERAYMGGSPILLNLKTTDGESATLDWVTHDGGVYRLYRNDTLVQTWDTAGSRIVFEDDPGVDGTYHYQVTWTSSAYPALVVKSTVCTFDRFTGELDPATFPQAPDAPRLTGRLVGGGPSVVLNWTPAQTGGTPSGYIIYRTDGGIPNTDNWDMLTNPRQSEPALDRYFATKVDTTQYRDSVEWGDDGNEETTFDLSPHRWWVVAFNDIGVSEPSEVVEYGMNGTALPVDNDAEAPGAPTQVSAKLILREMDSPSDDLTGQIDVTWGAPASGGSVAEYEAVFNDGEGGMSNKVVSNGDAQFASRGIAFYDDPADSDVGKTYTITVTARNNAGETTADPVTVTIESAPAFWAKAASATSVELTWTAPRGDRTPVDEYQLWHRSNGSSWQKVHTVSEPGSFTHGSVQTGQLQEYYVVAVDNTGKAHKSAVRTVTPTVYDGALAAPTNFQARAVDGNAHLSWTPADQGAVPGLYRLEYQRVDAYYDPDDDNRWLPISSSDVSGASSGMVVSGDTAAFARGSTYALRVRAHTADHCVISAPSNYVEFVWPAAAEPQQTTQPDPIDFNAEAGDGVVVLTWSKPTQSVEQGINRYMVVKMQGSTSSWWGIPSNAETSFIPVVDQNQAEYSFTDTDVVNGRTYTYELWPGNSCTWEYRSPYYLKGHTVTPNGRTTDQLVVENIEALANGLPDSAADFTSDDRAVFNELKANYQALSDYQRSLLDADVRAKIDSLITEVAHQDAAQDYADDEDVAAAQSAIAALDPDALSLDDDMALQAVANARAAYNALPADAKLLVDDANLRAAETKIQQLRKDAHDQAAADAVSDALDGIVLVDLESLSESELEDFEGQIANLRMEYNQLTKAQKAKVRSDSLAKLTVAETAIDDLNGNVHEHSIRAVPAKAATCQAAGNKAYYRCTECGKLFSDAKGAHEITPADVEIPLDTDAHVWDAGDVSRPATLEEPGSITVTCTLCGETRMMAIATPVTFKLSATKFSYDGKAKRPSVAVVDADGKVIAAENYDVSYANNTKVGNASAMVTFKGSRYLGEKSIAFTIAKGANPLKASGKTGTVKASKVKKKAQSLKVAKVVKFSNKGAGTLSYKKKSGNKKIAINKKTGKVTVKKGLKKGTYKVKVAIKAAGNGNYNAKTVNVTFKVKVK